MLTPVPQYPRQSRALAPEAPLVQELRAGGVIFFGPYQEPSSALVAPILLQHRGHSVYLKSAFQPFAAPEIKGKMFLLMTQSTGLHGACCIGWWPSLPQALQNPGGLQPPRQRGTDLEGTDSDSEDKIC